VSRRLIPWKEWVAQQEEIKHDTQRTETLNQYQERKQRKDNRLKQQEREGNHR
jgi:hypothetical protein